MGELDYGDIMEVKTTGASKETADADGHAKGYSGVTASERMAEYDKDDTNTYIDIIRKVGKENEIAPALICGIISRETRGGRAIRKPSPPIVDVDPNGGNHKRRGEWDSRKHLEQFPEFTEEQQLKDMRGAIMKPECREIDEIDPAIICGIISRVQRWESNMGQEWLGGTMESPLGLCR
uniref:Lysozyme g n=1 Tax=Oncorhynchus mykiss TaxID=8022 RepID=A0A8C7T5T4_ONCMY